MDDLKKYFEMKKKRRRKQFKNNLLFVFLLFILVSLMQLAWQTVYYFIFKYG